MRKVLLFLVVSFIVMGTLGAHAIIPDSATVEVPTPESDYSQDTDVQSENFAESESVAVEPAVDEATEKAADEVSAVDSEQVKETTVIETLNDTDAQSESSAEPEAVVVEPLVDEVAEQVFDETSAVDSEVPDEMVAESFNDVDVEPEPIAMESVVDEVVEQPADEVPVVDSEQVEETAVVETFNDVDVELKSSVGPEVYAEPEPVVVEPSVDEVTEQVSDEMSAVDSEAPDEMVAESFNVVDVEPEPVVVEPSVDEGTEQSADELPVVDSESPEETVAEPFNVLDVEPEPVVVDETEDVDEDEESEQTPYIEDMEENVAETEVSEPVAADIEPAGDDTEDGQTVMDIVPDEGNDNDMESVDVQAEEDEPLVESDESDKKSGINGKVLLSMEATHFAWNFSSNGGGYGLALPCSGVSAEWLFSNRFACGFDVRISMESDGTSYRTNLGILNRFGMLSAVKNFLNEANIVFFKGDVLLGLTIKDAVGGIATLPTIGLGGSVHFGRDFLTMAFGVNGTVMFPLSGADRAPVCSIRPNMSLTWIL